MAFRNKLSIRDNGKLYNVTVFDVVAYVNVTIERNQRNEFKPIFITQASE